MSAAGWSRGVFSAVKLCHSVSASGPRTRVKPSPLKTSQTSSITCVIGWKAPRQLRRPGSVRSSPGSALRCAPSSSAARASSSVETTAFTRFASAPTAGRWSGSSSPRRRRIAVRRPSFRPRKRTRADSNAAASVAASISRLASLSSASSSRTTSVAILCTPRRAAPLPYTATPPDPPTRAAPLPPGDRAARRSRLDLYNDPLHLDLRQDRGTEDRRKRVDDRFVRDDAADAERPVARGSLLLSDSGTLHELREGLRVTHRQVRQDLAVDLDPRLLEPVHEARVAHVVQPGRRVDPRDPQPPEITLALLPVPVRVLPAELDRVLLDPPQLRPGSPVSLRRAQVPLLLPMPRYGIRRTCHPSPPRQQPLHPRRVRTRDERRLRQPPLPLRRLLRQNVA